MYSPVGIYAHAFNILSSFIILYLRMKLIMHVLIVTLFLLIENSKKFDLSSALLEFLSWQYHAAQHSLLRSMQLLKV